MINSSGSANGSSNSLAPDHASEIYDQLLALGKDAAAAYVDLYQKTTDGIGEFRDKLGMASGLSWGDAGPGRLPGLPVTEVGERLGKARERAEEVSEMLHEMSKKMTLGFLNAYELAALAMADCQEEIAAMSGLELVKTVGEARGEFTREVTKACVSTARDIVG